MPNHRTDTFHAKPDHVVPFIQKGERPTRTDYNYATYIVRALRGEIPILTTGEVDVTGLSLTQQGVARAAWARWVSVAAPWWSPAQTDDADDFAAAIQPLLASRLAPSTVRAHTSLLARLHRECSGDLAVERVREAMDGWGTADQYRLRLAWSAWQTGCVEAGLAPPPDLDPPLDQILPREVRRAAQWLLVREDLSLRQLRALQWGHLHREGDGSWLGLLGPLRDRRLEERSAAALDCLAAWGWPGTPEAALGCEAPILPAAPGSSRPLSQGALSRLRAEADSPDGREALDREAPEPPLAREGAGAGEEGDGSDLLLPVRLGSPLPSPEERARQAQAQREALLERLGGGPASAPEEGGGCGPSPEGGPTPEVALPAGARAIRRPRRE